IGEWGEIAFNWFRDTFEWLIDLFSLIIGLTVNGIVDGLLAVPAIILIAVFALIGWFLRSWQLAAGTIITFLLVVSMGFWESTMQTLGLVIVATLIAVIIAVPLGILAAKNDKFSAVVKP